MHMQLHNSEVTYFQLASLAPHLRDLVELLVAGDISTFELVISTYGFCLFHRIPTVSAKLGIIR